MKKLISITAVMLISLLISGCLSYRVSPPSRQVNVDDVFTVDIVLDRCLGPFQIGGQEVKYCSDADDIYGMAFDLNYDPALLELVEVDVSSGALSGATVRTGFRNSASENGNLVIGISKQGQVPGEKAGGLIASVTFRAKASGTSDLVFDDPHIIDSLGRFYVGWPTYQAGLHSGTVFVDP